MDERLFTGGARNEPYGLRICPRFHKGTVQVPEEEPLPERLKDEIRAQRQIVPSGCIRAISIGDILRYNPVKEQQEKSGQKEKQK